VVAQPRILKMDFKTWSHENLVSFAEAANAKMKEQDDRIQQLQCDLKDALAALRKIWSKE